jgi:hypothetical protein
MHTSTRLLGAVAVAAVLSQTSSTWAQTGPNLVIAMTHTGNFMVGANGVYTIVVSNIGGTPASSGPIDVLVPLTGPEFFRPLFSFVSGTGTGWNCIVVGDPFQDALCRTSPPIPAGGSAPPITLTVLPNVSGTVANTAELHEDFSRIATVTDVTIVLAGVPTLPQWALIALTALLARAGVVALRRRRT